VDGRQIDNDHAWWAVLLRIVQLNGGLLAHHCFET